MTPGASTRLRLALLGVVAMLVAGACGGGEVTLAGYERDPEPSVGDITLPAVNRGNVDFAFRAEPGELLLVYFGFASCPDVCPTTLADTRLALADLGDRAQDVNLALVTVDPDRDTPEITTDYVEAFIEGSIALRTDDADALADAANAFGVSYAVTENDAGEIEVAHTPFLFAVDDQGSLVLTWQFGVPPADLTSDLEILLDRRA